MLKLKDLWSRDEHGPGGPRAGPSSGGPHFCKFSQQYANSLNKHSRDTGHTAIYQGKPKFSWNPLPLLSPPQLTT